MLIPQAIAYAHLAGMPPHYGLYAGTLPLIVYGLLGSSPHVSVGPVAISSILVLSGVSLIAEPMSETYISLVLGLGLLAGLFQWMLGVFQLGFLVNFLSHPVLNGFVSGAAVVIIGTQISHLLGLPSNGSAQLWGTITYSLGHLSDIHVLTLAISIGCLLFLVLARRVSKVFPAALLVVLICGLMTYLGELHLSGVSIVGEIPDGLPHFVMPSLNYGQVVLLAPAVFTIGIMSSIEALSIAKSLEMGQNNYEINPNAELRAVGLAKVVGSFFQSLPSSVSFSRSAISATIGAQTGVASILSGSIVALGILFCTSALFYIPKATLAAIIVASVFRLVDWKRAWQLYKIQRTDFVTLITTFLTTIFIGIQYGVLIGVLLSFGLLLYQSSRPRVMELGRLPNSNVYRNIRRFEEAVVEDSVIILRWDNQLFFANAEYFNSKVLSALRSRRMPPSHMIIDMSNVHDMDTTGLHVLQGLVQVMCGRDIQLLFAGTKGVVRDLFKRSNFYETCPECYHFLRVSDAMAFINQAEGYSWNEGAIQSNS